MARDLLPRGKEVTIETTTHTFYRGKLYTHGGWVVVEGPEGRSTIRRSMIGAVTEGSTAAPAAAAPTPPATLPPPRLTGLLGRQRVRVTLASLVAATPPREGEDAKSYVRRISYKPNRVWTPKDEKHFSSTLHRYGFAIARRGKSNVITAAMH